MNNILIMPALAAVGTIFIIALIITIIITTRSREKIARMKSLDAENFNRFAEEIKRENAEIKKDLHTIKEKVAAIDGMMKDI